MLSRRSSMENNTEGKSCKDIAKLNPCKICGSTDIRISRSVIPFLETELYAVYCYHCGNGTRESLMEKAVILEWNKVNK